MKKLSILLLVVALAGGMAFGAELAITGDAVYSVSYDLATGTFGSDGAVGTFEYDASIELIAGGAASAMGEGDVYAVLEVSVDAWEIAVDEATAPALPGISAVDFDTFKIVAGDTTIDLLGNSESGNFAQYFDYSDGAGGDPDDVADIDVASIGLAGQNGGVDVTNGDITVGVDYWSVGNVYLAWGSIATELADGVTATIAAGIDSAAGADAGAQLAYATDDYSVTVGVDTADNFALYEVEADIDAVIDVITIDANVYFDGATIYVADQNTVALDDLEIGVDFYWNDLASGSYIGADVTTDIDSITVALNGGYDLDTPGFDATLDVDFAVDDATTVGAYVSYDGAVTAGGDVAIAMEDGDLTASVDWNGGTDIDVAIEFSSTTLVSGATLALGWTADDVAADLGDIVASVTVEL